MQTRTEEIRDDLSMENIIGLIVSTPMSLSSHVKEKAAQILAIQLVLQESIKRKESKDIQNQLFRKGISHFEVKT